MKLSFIIPTHFLERYATRSDILLALAHLIDDKGENKYATFYRRKAEQGYRTICDNGLFEGEQVSTETLLRRADVIHAQTVCAPDVLYDSQGTIKEFKQFIKAKQEYGLVADVMGIPQADDPVSWWECYRFMELSKDCQLIGLSILSVARAFKRFSTEKEPITSARCYIIRQLCLYESLIGRRIKPTHLLGLGESYADILLAKRILPSVVSNDSSSCFVHGYLGQTYNNLGMLPNGKVHDKLDFDIDTLTKQQEDDIDKNIKIALQIRGYSFDT